jgi:hypothetical protein
MRLDPETACPNNTFPSPGEISMQSENVCRIRVLVAAAVLSAVPFSPAAAADWPQWGGGQYRNLVSREAGLPASFHPGRKKRDRLGFDPATTKNVRWMVRLGSENYSCPVVANGRVYIGTNDEDLDDERLRPTRGGVLMCLDEKTGSLVWRLVVPRLEIDRSKVSEDFDDMNLGVCSTATVDGDRVYLVTNRCEVVCLDVAGMANGNDGEFFVFANTASPVEKPNNDLAIGLGVGLGGGAAIGAGAGVFYYVKGLHAAAHKVAVNTDPVADSIELA